MKALAEQDHYEILEVARSSSRPEIARAYELARGTYSDDSLAAYSVLGHDEVSAIRERLDTAFRVLSNDETRRAYDEALLRRERDAEPLGAGEELAPPPLPLPEIEDLGDLEEAEDDEAEYDGARLRRARMRRGLGLDDVSRATKVNPNYLRMIEDETFRNLPARVYVRGFVLAYATCVGLDALEVCESYMRRFDAGGRARLARADAPRP